MRVCDLVLLGGLVTFACGPTKQPLGDGGGLLDAGPTDTARSDQAVADTTIDVRNERLPDVGQNPPFDASQLADAGTDARTMPSDVGMADRQPPTSGWTLENDRSITTRPTDHPGSHGIGTSVAISHDGLTLIVGETGAPPAGRVHVYQRTSRQETFPPLPTQTLLGTRRDWRTFGDSVALSHDARILVVGDPGFQDTSSPNTGVGAAHIFQRDSATGSFGTTPTQSVRAPISNTNFASAVVISGDGLQLFVGAPWEDANGVISMFQRDSRDALFPSARTTIPRPPEMLDFGSALAISDDALLLVTSSESSRYVHLFNRNSTSESFPATPTESFATPREIAAWRLLVALPVALRGDGLMLVIGDTRYYETNGAVFSYERGSRSGRFGAPAQIFGGPRSADMYDPFGYSLALSADGSELYVGAPAFSGGPGGEGRGAVWTYRR